MAEPRRRRTSSPFGWDPILGWVNSPPILEPILVVHCLFASFFLGGGGKVPLKKLNQPKKGALFFPSGHLSLGMGMNPPGIGIAGFSQCVDFFVGNTFWGHILTATAISQSALERCESDCLMKTARERRPYCDGYAKAFFGRAFRTPLRWIQIRNSQLC